MVRAVNRAEYEQNGASAPGDAEPRAAVKQRRMNRRLAFVIVGVMLGLALLSLAVGLKTVPGRRVRDARDPLAYLPADSNVVALIEVSKALQTVAGNDLLNELRLGPNRIGIATIEQWTGLGRNEIGALVVAGHVVPQEQARFGLVVQTMHPHPEGQFETKLKGTLTGRGAKRLYALSGDSTELLWNAADTILIIGITPDAIDRVPDQPQRGLGYLIPEVSKALTERVPNDAQALLVVHSPGWQKTPLARLVGQLSSESPSISNDMPTATVWARFDKSVTLGGAFFFNRSSDLKTAVRELEKNPVWQDAKMTVSNQGWITVEKEHPAARLRSIFSAEFKP
jgi:hypothetical protein